MGATPDPTKYPTCPGLSCGQSPVGAQFALTAMTLVAACLFCGYFKFPLVGVIDRGARVQ
jgi:hypothetical protein